MKNVEDKREREKQMVSQMIALYFPSSGSRSSSCDRDKEREEGIGT